MEWVTRFTLFHRTKDYGHWQWREPRDDPWGVYEDPSPHWFERTRPCTRKLTNTTLPLIQIQLPISQKPPGSEREKHSQGENSWHSKYLVLSWYKIVWISTLSVKDLHLYHLHQTMCYRSSYCSLRLLLFQWSLYGIPSLGKKGVSKGKDGVSKLFQW